MAQYLYGASVQGIQRFIFQTNELKDIVGASELVELICTDLFKSIVGNGWKAGHQVISAAGNVKYIFDNREDCAQVVRRFPREAMEAAPGITISQAVVELQDDFTLSINELENKLRSQRNKQAKSLITGRLGIRRLPQTGLPITVKKGAEGLDASTYAKKKQNKTVKLSQKSFGNKEKAYHGKPLADAIPFDVSHITGKNDWIAVVHADGNGLGKVVQKIGHDRDDFKTFSHELDKATVAAANDAFKHVSPEGGWEDVIPIRPIVLGGDDMTVIIRGNLAIDYVTEFMQQFEKHTGEGELKKILGKANMQQLTACAGVAFIKSSYPFYYGYSLAEQLCDKTKKITQKVDEKLAPSCLMFHKIQDSFVMRYDDMVERELTTVNKNSFQFGPYYLQKSRTPEGYFTIEDLQSISKKLNEKDGIRTGIRQWLTLMHEDEGQAHQRLERLKTFLELYLAKSASLAEEWAGYAPYSTAEKAEPNYTVYGLELHPADFTFFGSGFGDDRSDMTFVREPVIQWTDGEAEIIERNQVVLVPASSVKGALAHRTAYHFNKLKGTFADQLPTEDLAKYTGKNNEAVITLFGSEGNNKGEGKQRGNILFSDAFIEQNQPVEGKVLNHVKIDRFTGGAVTGALFSEEVLYARDQTVQLELLLSTAVTDEDALKAFESALTDLCKGWLPLGGGVNRGNGTFTGKLTKNGETIYEYDKRH